MLACFLALQGLSGATLVFRDEIEPLIHPSLRVEVSGARVPLEAMRRTVSEAHPEATVGRIEVPSDARQAVLFKLKDRTGAPLLLAVDPYRGAIVKQGGLAAWPTEWIFLLHEQLTLGKTGDTLIGIEGLALLFIAVTGPIVWWPGRRRIGQGLHVRWRAKPDLRWRTIHRAGGAVIALVLIVSATTGVLMVWKEPFRSLVGAWTPAPGKPAPQVADESRAQLVLDELVARAQAIYPTELRQLRFSSGGRVVAVYLAGDRSVRADGTNQVYLNAYDGAVLARYVSGEVPAGSEAIDWFYTIHTGLWGGLASKLLMSIAGLGLVGLALTGPWLWWSRTRARRARAGKRALVGEAA